MRTARAVDSGARWGLIGLVVLAPLPFGAVLGWTTALLTCGVGLLLAAVCARHLAGPGIEVPGGTRQVALAGGLLALPAALQLVPLPAALVRVLSPATASFHEAGVLDSAGWRPLSQDPGVTGSALLWLVTCAVAALLVTLLFERRHLKRLLTVLIAAGVAQSFYGILEFLSGRNHIFLYEKRHYLDSATGTYINRNHFAGLLVLLLPPALAFLLSRVEHHDGTPRPQGWRRRLLAFAESRRHQTLLLALSVTVMATGLGLSFSRAGVTFGLAALAATVFFQALAPSRRRFRRSRPALVWAMALLLLALIPLAVRGPGRLGSMSEDVPGELTGSTGRPAVWAATLRMATEHPLLGTGLGTFALTFPRYRPAEVQATYTHAHQDYLQWFAETGLAGLVAGGLVLAGLIVAARRAVRQGERRHERLIAAGIGAGLAGFALHGLVDFNGHIPANALTASVLAASLVVLARRETGETGHAQEATS